MDFFTKLTQQEYIQNRENYYKFINDSESEDSEEQIQNREIYQKFVNDNESEDFESQGMCKKLQKGASGKRWIIIMLVLILVLSLLSIPCYFITKGNVKNDLNTKKDRQNTKKTGERCELSDALAALTDYTSKAKIVSHDYNIFVTQTEEVRTLQGVLDISCESVAQHRAKYLQTSGLFKVVQQYQPLKVFIEPMQAILEKCSSQPVDTFCTTSKQVQKTQQEFFYEVNGTFFSLTANMVWVNTKLEDVIDYISYCETNGTQSKNLDNQVKKICKVSQDLNTFLDPIYSNTTEFVSHVNDVEEIENSAINGYFKPVGDVFQKLDAVLKPIDDLLATKFKIPVVKGSKDRGVGEIPYCCPDNYENSAGLCYKKCDEGYDTVGLLCIQKCAAGWNTFTWFCLKWLQVKARHTYGRGVGIIPAVFGKVACTCRSDKRDLEAGLCYNECGEGSFATYPVAVLERCYGYSTRMLTIQDYLNHKNIQKDPQKIPGLTDALAGINTKIDQVFGPISDKIKYLQNMTLPYLPSAKLSLPQVPNALLDLPERQYKFTELANAVSELPDQSQSIC
eukprot:TRINITY_DN7931_c1_g1_i2.p1 TRINITY_DN7931_c1_g1~~TRINITY_DN7931_c1_g1_i2.p1  ORF type:complete len:565 (-),score=68.09 TRINITY_DN7931_c1_g1_i2:909-2603(-)